MDLFDSASKAFFKMIKSIDDFGSVGSGVSYGEVRPGDLTFIDTSSLEGDGFVYLVKVKDDKKATYHRVYWTDETITLCCPTDGEIKGAYPAADVEIRGRVTGVYRELPAAPMVDIEQHSRMFESIKKTDCGAYQLTWGEIEAIRAREKGGPAACIMDAFRWGFLKGQRSEKARAKKKRQEGNTK